MSNTKIVRQQGGDELTVKDGGEINIEDGGVLEIDGKDVTDEVEGLDGLDTANMLSSIAAGNKFVMGEYTVTAGDATANAATIDTGLTTVESAIVQVVDSGNNVVTSDADVTFADENIVVADGATYNTTAGYKVRWSAFGV
ncbi:MAG TPA: hypothetical protein VJ279_02215 [Hanamia sp.]|jgi:hypothetical protein|nr:hypothetical protein [Hanamia sp.]